MSEYRLDRILQDDEIAQLTDLLVPQLTKDFPNFNKWLENAQEEIAKGSRIALGIWKDKLVAASIIKLTASNVAELKTFFIDPSFRDSIHSNILYKEIEAHSRKAGTIRIITYVYVDNISLIEFLISEGFTVSGKEDLYGNSRLSYILSKTLNPEYFGDPFDWEALGEWYLQSRMNAIKIKDHPSVDGRKFDKNMKITVGNYALKALVEIKDQKVDQDIVEILHKKCSESDYHIPIFVAREFTDRAQAYAKKAGVIIFSSVDIAEILGRKPPIFRDGDVKGMVVSIRPEFLERLLRRKSPYYY